MKVKQHVYFGFWSQKTAAAQITSLLRIEPDKFVVRGSRNMELAIPKYHWWRISCDQPGLRIEDQITRILDRIKPRQLQITELVKVLVSEDPPGGALLQVIRYFNDDDGDEDSTLSRQFSEGTELEKLSGQHPLLGWHLEAEVLAFLHSVGAEVDVDEYN